MNYCLREKKGEHKDMIVLHKINGDEFVMNSNHIEVIEKKPDTTITLTNDRKYIVKETIDEVLEKVRNYHRLLLTP